MSEASAQAALHVDVEHFSWREETTPIEVKESGPRFAFGARYVQPKANGLLFATRGRVYVGGVDYEGSFQFDVTEMARGTSEYLGTTLGAELRYRWPETVDAVTGLELDLWKRQLSVSQREDYRILSARVGFEHDMPTSPFIAGGGIRMMLVARESATIEADGFLYSLELSPGLGNNPYFHAGVRLPGRVTMLAYWDGMRLGRSNELTLVKRGRPQATVSQPPSDVDMLGLRVSYGW